MNESINHVTTTNIADACIRPSSEIRVADLYIPKDPPAVLPHHRQGCLSWTGGIGKLSGGGSEVSVDADSAGLVGVGAAQRMDTFGTSTSISIAQLDSTPRELSARVWSSKQPAAALMNDDTGPRIENPVTTASTN